MRFLDLDRVRLQPHPRTHAYYVPEGTCADLLQELVLLLDLFLHAQHQLTDIIN